MTSSHLRCSNPTCAEEQPRDLQVYSCPACQGLLELTYDFPLAEAPGWPQLWQRRLGHGTGLDGSGVWRFRELLPLFDAPTPVVSLGEGCTPLVAAPRAARWADLGSFFVKHQGSNPTGSFKDLGMTVCVTEALRQDVGIVACASTGNTSSSMAAYAARAGMRSLVFVPRGAVSGAKLAQAIDFGAQVVETGENFDQAFQLLRQMAGELGLYLVNSINPFRLEGQKTVVLELLAQRQWQPPDYIVLPGGNLGNVSAVGKCLAELASLNLLQKMPRLVVVQAEGASPFHQMRLGHSSRLAPDPQPSTRATAIRIGNPANWPRAVRALELTEGLTEAVTDEEIRAAKAELAQGGIGCEPASAATLAGVRKLRLSGAIEEGAEVVAILTGHQLKDPDYIMEQVQSRGGSGVLSLDPDPEAIRRGLRSWL
ncbi:MAG: threonine synthase [Candidatus Dormibacteria bacterium]